MRRLAKSLNSGGGELRLLGKWFEAGADLRHDHQGLRAAWSACETSFGGSISSTMEAHQTWAAAMGLTKARTVSGVRGWGSVGRRGGLD